MDEVGKSIKDESRVPVKHKEEYIEPNEYLNIIDVYTQIGCNNRLPLGTRLSKTSWVQALVAYGRLKAQVVKRLTA